MNDLRHDVLARPGVFRRLVVGACLALAALGAGAPRAAASEPVNLAPKFQKGQTWRFHYRVYSEMDFAIAGEKQAMTLTKEVVVRTTVTSTSDDGATIELIHEAIKLDARGQVPGSFDSTKPSKDDTDDVYAHILRPLVGVPLMMNVDKDGKIISVSGLDAIQPQGVTESILFHQLFGQDEFIRMYEPLFSIKPDEPEARRGDSWDVKRREASMLGIVESDLTLTLERTTRHQAHIEIGGTQSVLPATGGSGKVSESRVRGSCVWDLDDGVMLRMKTTSTTKFAPDKDSTAGTPITGEANATTELERLDSSGH